ncbi:helix-turn-helix transcriptional regulator [Candidatus Sumerlaeota bacterium]|nr:helix-turn-helix transcriptional regulator [Candidatus Sumerlaeota bacterium]MBI3735101.1 helix-turn-helix transcriptional regulator [Candidatus Sumerlaeota bacterium]
MDAKATIGRAIRVFRESAGLSQEKLAERAGITYQYLSSLENGKENFSIGVLESIAGSLGLDFPTMVDRAYGNVAAAPAVSPRFFIHDAPLPPFLDISHVSAALNETHKIIRLINASLIKASGRPLPSYIQGNNFSGIVSNVLCDSFSRLSPYKHNHAQRYPDLVCKGANDEILAGLEVKTTILPGKGGESHNGHSGWHLVACFNLDGQSGDIRFVHVMFANLIGHGKARADWQYVGSKVNKETGSQRTETYTTTPAGTAKLRHGTVYLDPAINISRWRTSPDVRVPAYSPFRIKGGRGVR